MWTRWLRHLGTTHLALRRAFPAATLAAIDQAVAASEAGHRAELRVALEAHLPAALLWRGVTARQRAEDLFASLRVYDTAGNNGILLYVLLAEQDIEIVADRGFAGRVPPAEWAAICTTLEAAYRAGAYREGTLAAIAAIGAIAARHFPPAGGNPDELPDRTVIL